METKMKKILLFFICFFVLACSPQNKTKKFIPGQIARQVIFCSSPNECKTRLVADCPKGGIIHGAANALRLEYSCSSNP